MAKPTHTRRVRIPPDDVREMAAIQAGYPDPDEVLLTYEGDDGRIYAQPRAVVRWEAVDGIHEVKFGHEEMIDVVRNVEPPEVGELLAEYNTGGEGSRRAEPTEVGHFELTYRRTDRDEPEVPQLKEDEPPAKDPSPTIFKLFGPSLTIGATNGLAAGLVTWGLTTSKLPVTVLGYITFIIAAFLSIDAASEV